MPKGNDNRDRRGQQADSQPRTEDGRFKKEEDTDTSESYLEKGGKASESQNTLNNSSDWDPEGDMDSDSE